MQILVVNDDGITSPGIWALAGALQATGLGDVIIVAPEHEQSGTSMALPPGENLTLRPVTPPDPACNAIAAYAFNGTPVGCVLAGVLAGIVPRPDLVVSGINRGLNTGTNVLLSGTVGAAMMAALWGIPAMAISQMFVGEAPMPWQTATWATVRLLPSCACSTIRAQWCSTSMYPTSTILLSSAVFARPTSPTSSTAT